MLSQDEALAQARDLHNVRRGERLELNQIRRYWRGVQRLPEVIPASSPREVRTMARIARVNICAIVIDVLAQSTFVDGFRAAGPADEDGDNAVWDIWQANKMDARQTGIHRAAFAYGASYAIVLPGDPVPVIRGVSPRNLTAVYGDDPDWPEFALEYRRNREWRLYDNEAVYTLKSNNRGSEFDLIGEPEVHDAGVTPVVRYLDEEDLDADDDVTADAMAYMEIGKPLRGQIFPLMSVQDQIDLSTFGLKVAEWYAAFRQRYILGWVPDDEAQKMKAAASQLWTLDVDAKEVTVGEFSQTDLSGYIASREASMKHAATLSQTPVHELIGELVNLSAEALAAAEKGHERKVDEKKALLGESHEQALRLAAELGNVQVPDGAEVVWRDTSARAFAATIDGLGKLAQMLGIPPQELWQRVPGATRQEIERWTAAAANSSSFDELARMLEAETAAGAKVNINE